MNRTNEILHHQAYRIMMETIHQTEINRPYCRHGLDHCLDVARIAYILNLEEQYHYEADIIYAAALLHDIGKSETSNDEESHAQRSARLAVPILKDCGYTDSEIRLITEAIGAHGHQNEIKEKNLSQLIQRADHKSRNCYSCKKTDDCNWTKEQKNGGILW